MIDLKKPCEECGERPGHPITFAPQGDLTRQRVAFICGECHGHDDPPPIGIVVAVIPWTFRENVAYTVSMVRHARKEGFAASEELFLNDLRALLASRHDGGQR